MKRPEKKMVIGKQKNIRKILLFFVLFVILISFLEILGTLRLSPHVCLVQYSKADGVNFFLFFPFFFCGILVLNELAANGVFVF